ncbi:hypothetical protein L211DRAFT_804507 [Terfezia boudieri ATCC MYA-4762]|uniref:Nonsense-mediated mRNA decay factor n=1 Tax=Terfezia boudieri ATCC MYA-4762 TaxID=1051890 RepID=A0A3N4LZ70_9PEZI|nr:hypothetical protein L211DRAFT_804507 [Terfezia boudieri ATCC MYA-4762]
MEGSRPVDMQVEQLHLLAARWETDLEDNLKDQALGRNIDYAIAQIRNNYQDIIFLDFEYAVAHDIEGKIWTKHHRIIERYRRNIHKLRETAGKKKPVELRKMLMNFINFIKATTKFYRGFIQRLASHFGVFELEPVVEQFKLTVSEPDEPITPSPELKQLIIRSCHRCLVILGDLSRYREVGSSTEKNWAPATGYYDLAKKLVPDSGSPHNQLAVISMSDGSNLSATYHLYRAVSVKEPFPEAGNNLGLGFQKILKAYRSGKLGSNLVRKEEQQVSELLSLFTRLHAKYFNGKENAEVHESLQGEMLAQLTQDLKERLLSEGMLSKLVLINIAAEAYAANRQPGREAIQALNNFLNLNVQTFNTLLLVFQPELERVTVNRDKPTNPTEYVSAVGRRMLPALRLYSKWLLVSYEKLRNTIDDTSLAVQTKQLWQTYANTLTLLAATFNVNTLPRLDYMLEEDEDIIGFLPLASASKRDDYFKADATEVPLLKQDKNSPYRVHPNEEQLSRVLLLLEDGLTLCRNSSVPIAVVDGTIIYQEDGMNTSILPTSLPAGLNSLSRPEQGPAFTDMPPEMLPVQPQVERPVSLMVGLGGGSVVGSVAPSESASVMVAMNRMVDSIVGPRGGTVSEEDEEDLRLFQEEKDEGSGRKVEKSKNQHGKEGPLEEEEILFVGRKGRLGGRSKGSTPTKICGVGAQDSPEIPGDSMPPMAQRIRDSADAGNFRSTPPMAQKERLLPPTSMGMGSRKKDIAGGYAKPTDSSIATESRFETQIPHPPLLTLLQQFPSLSPPPPSRIPPPLPAISPSSSTPIHSTPAATASPVATTGTYTASDLVKQLHSYSSQMMNAARESTNITPSRSPQLPHLPHSHAHTHHSHQTSPVSGGSAGRGDLWWALGGAAPGNGGVYSEGETSLFLYGTGGGGWSGREQSQGGDGEGRGSPTGYR